MFVIFLVKVHVDAEDDEDDENYVDCNRKTLIPGSRSKWAMGGKEEVGNQYVKEGGQGVAARNSPLLGAGKKKQDFSPPLQPISLTTKQSWSKTLIGGGGWSETVTTNLPPK